MEHKTREEMEAILAAENTREEAIANAKAALKDYMVVIVVSRLTKAEIVALNKSNPTTLAMYDCLTNSQNAAQVLIDAAAAEVKLLRKELNKAKEEANRWYHKANPDGMGQ